MNKKSKFLPIYSFPLLLSLVTSVSFATNYKINNYDLKIKNINNINNILKEHLSKNFNNIEIDYTSLKEKVEFTNEDNVLLKIENILKNNEKKYNDFISPYNQIDKIDLKNLKVGYRYSDKYYNKLYPTPQLFGQTYLNIQERFFEKKSSNLTKGYFKSLGSEPIDNIQHPNYVFQLYTKYGEDKKWIWEDENILNINLELTKFLENNQYDPKKDLYLWFLQDNLRIENIPTKSNHTSSFYQEKIVVDETSSINLLTISQDANLYCTNMVPFNAEIRNENNEIEKEWIEYRYFYSKVKKDENKNKTFTTKDNVILKPQQPFEESLDSFKEGIAFFVRLSPDTLIKTKSQTEYKISDFLSNNILGNYQKHFKEVLLEQEKDISFFRNSNSKLKNSSLKIESSNQNIFFQNQDYSLKNQILDLFIPSSEVDIRNFIEPIFTKGINQNKISFDFSNAFKNLIIGLKEAIDNNYSLVQVTNSQWYIESKKEFDFYLDNNNFVYIQYFLSWIKDFFIKDIYIEYDNQKLKIWDSSLFEFTNSINFSSNSIVINKMYKEENQSINLISKVKVSESSGFSIANGNLIFELSNEIESINIDNAKITLDNDLAIIYTGQEIKPKILVELNNQKLIENQDYELIYSNNINVGQATILIRAKGKYKGEKQFNFSIEKSNNQITKFEIDKDLNIIVESTFGIPYIKYFSDQECKNQLDNKPTQPGTYYVKAFVDETENYNFISSIAKQYIISQSDLNSPSTPGNINELEIVFDNQQIEYIGSSIEPNIEIKFQGNKLERGKDFELTFSNNINVGQATIYINGIGDLEWIRLKKTFEIIKAKNIIDIKYDKDQNITEVKSNFGKIELLSYFLDQECKNKLDKKPTQPGTYYAKVFVVGTDNYEQVEKIIEFNIKETNKNNIPLVIGLTIGTLLGLGIIVALIIFIKKVKK